MELQQALVVVVVILLLILLNKKNKPVNNKSASNGGNSEGYRPRSRAYYSCPESDCRGKKVTPDQMLVINPFLWPYSGTTTPQEVLSKSAPEGLLLSEPDHENLTN